MFREMRRSKQALDQEACKKLLKEENRGVLAVNGDEGYPYCMPMDFLYVPEENRIYFHGARTGHRLDSVKKCDKVCFTAHDSGYKKEGHWEWTLNSVIVFGRMKVLEEPELLEERLRKFGSKYYPDMEELEEVIRDEQAHMTLYALEIEHMTGKTVNEK